MFPFDNSDQPTHAGQPAGASSSAPDEEPNMPPFDAEGLPFDLTFLDTWMDPPTGLWDSGFASQGLFDPGLSEQVAMPSLNAEGPHFDYNPNSWPDKTFDFDTGVASQSAPSSALNDQATMLPFDFNPWMDQPLGLSHAEVASQSALFALGEALNASDGGPSYLQGASFDCLHPVDWINDDAGMPDALGGFADPVSMVRSSNLNVEHMSKQAGMAIVPQRPSVLPHLNHYPGAVEVPEQQAHASTVFGLGSKTCSTLANNGPSTSRTRKHKKSQELKCDFEGCAHDGKFRRKWELIRHKAKHGVASFVCRAEGCFNKQLQWTFTRPDKLTSHIKACHTRDTVFTACPVDGCVFGRCTLETLGVHIERAHQSWEGRAVINASTCKVRKCPLWQCGKHVKARELLGHIAQHDENELMMAISRLEAEGLALNSTTQSDRAQGGLVITVRCPICGTLSDDPDHFVTHFWTNHLFIDGSDGVDHFIAWKSTLIDHTTKDFHREVELLLPWTNLKHLRCHHRGAETVQCPSCLFSYSGLCAWYHPVSESQQAAFKEFSAHHLSLLRPEAEVIAEFLPHRIEILRLYPEFVSHPVFADFDRPRDYIPRGSQPSQA